MVAIRTFSSAGAHNATAGIADHHDSDYVSPRTRITIGIFTALFLLVLLAMMVVAYRRDTRSPPPRQCPNNPASPVLLRRSTVERVVQWRRTLPTAQVFTRPRIAPLQLGSADIPPPREGLRRSTSLSRLDHSLRPPHAWHTHYANERESRRVYATVSAPPAAYFVSDPRHADAAPYYSAYELQ